MLGGSSFLGAALAKTRASRDGHAAATRHRRSDCGLGSRAATPPPRVRRRREAPSRWDVDSSERTPRSSDDTTDSIAEWHEKRLASLQRASRAQDEEAASPISNARSRVPDFNCSACEFALDYCACSDRGDRRSVRVLDFRSSCPGCMQTQPFVRKGNVSPIDGLFHNRARPTVTKPQGDYPAHPDDSSLAAALESFVDAAWGAIVASARRQK